MTPLHVAAERPGQEEILEVLLISGCKVNARNKVGRTALHVAAKLGQHENLKVLLDGGANPKSRDKFGLTPLEVAQKYNWEKCVEVLLCYKPCRDRLTSVNKQIYNKNSSCTKRLSETREGEEHLCICCTADSDSQWSEHISVTQRVHDAAKRATYCCGFVTNTNLNQCDYGAQSNTKTSSEHSSKKDIGSKFHETTVFERKNGGRRAGPCVHSKLQATAKPVSLDVCSSNVTSCNAHESSLLVQDDPVYSANFCKEPFSFSKTKHSLLSLKINPKRVVLSSARTMSPAPEFLKSVSSFRKRLFTWPESLSESFSLSRHLMGGATKFDECQLPILFNVFQASIFSANSRKQDLALVSNSTALANRLFEESQFLRSNTVLTPELAARAFTKICFLASSNPKVLCKLCDALFLQVFGRFHLNPEAVAKCLFVQTKYLQTIGVHSCKARLPTENKPSEVMSQEYLSFLDGLGLVINRPYTPLAFSDSLLVSMLTDVPTAFLLLTSDISALYKLLEQCLLDSTQHDSPDVDRIAMLFLRVSSSLNKYTPLLCKFVDLVLSLVFQYPEFPLLSFGTRLLTRMGLLKDELPVDIFTNLEGPLIALEHAFGQGYFPRSLASIFVAFLSKKCVKLTKYGKLHANALKSALLKEIIPQSTEEAFGYSGRGFRRVCETFAHLAYWETSYQCSDIFFSELLNKFNCLPWTVGESILVYLGLLKSEFPVEVLQDTRAGLKILRNIVTKDCFSKNTSGLFIAFLRKPNVRLVSCSTEVEEILMVLKGIE